MRSSILLIHCNDRPGLVYKITEVVYKHHLNIISNGEFVERNLGHFFMRTEFSGDYETDVFLDQLRNSLPADAAIKLSQKQRRNICILVTKEHHCLSDLLIRHSFGELNINLACIISNYQNLEAFANKFSIPFHFISHQQKTREEHEREMLAAIQQYDPEFLVLAKYMRILTPDFARHFANRIINIHHSFLPAFVGANPTTRPMKEVLRSLALQRILSMITWTKVPLLRKVLFRLRIPIAQRRWRRLAKMLRRSF